MLIPLTEVDTASQTDQGTVFVNPRHVVKLALVGNLEAGTLVTRIVDVLGLATFVRGTPTDVQRAFTAAGAR